MIQTSSDQVLSHWCNLLDGFQMPPLEFYAAVEQAVKRRDIPNIEISRIDWHEEGILSAKREYLRVRRGRHIFDVCGAPFGEGFFVSSWLVKPKVLPWPVALFLLGLAASLVLYLSVRVFGIFGGPLGFLFLFPMSLWALALTMSANEGWDDSIVMIPVIGPIYQWVFRPETYYRIDTLLMFQEAVHHAVLEAVDQVTSNKGLRGLSDLERKPAMLELTRAAGH